jgi:hypothetical protein
MDYLQNLIISKAIEVFERLKKMGVDCQNLHNGLILVRLKNDNEVNIRISVVYHLENNRRLVKFCTFKHEIFKGVSYSEGIKIDGLTDVQLYDEVITRFEMFIKSLDSVFDDD